MKDSERRRIADAVSRATGRDAWALYEEAKSESSVGWWVVTLAILSLITLACWVSLSVWP